MIDPDLPKLQSIVLDANALEGDFSDDRKEIPVEPYNYKNTLTLKSAFSLLRSFDRPSFPDSLQGKRIQFQTNWHRGPR